MKLTLTVGAIVAALVAHECWPISLMIIGLCVKVGYNDLKQSGWFKSNL